MVPPTSCMSNLSSLTQSMIIAVNHNLINRHPPSSPTNRITINFSKFNLLTSHPVIAQLSRQTDAKGYQTAYQSPHWLHSSAESFHMYPNSIHSHTSTMHNASKSLLPEASHPPREPRLRKFILVNPRIIRIARQTRRPNEGLQNLRPWIGNLRCIPEQ